MITGDSLTLIEEFLVRRRLGIGQALGVQALDIPARKLDAFLILQDEMEREERDGKTEH